MKKLLLVALTLTLPALASEAVKTTSEATPNPNNNSQTNLSPVFTEGDTQEVVVPEQESKEEIVTSEYVNKEDAEKKGGFIHNSSLKFANKIVERNLPREIDFSHMRLVFFPYWGADLLDFRLTENANFVEIDNYSRPYAIEAEKSAIRINPFAFLIGKVSITSMVLERPDIQIARKANGEFSFDDIVNGKKSSILNWIKIKKLWVADGKSRFYDMTAPGEPADLHMDKINMEISGFSLKDTFDLKFSMRGPGAEKPNVFVEGQAGPLNEDFTIDDLFFDLDVKIVNGKIEPYKAYIPKDLPIIPVKADTYIDYHMVGDMTAGINVWGTMQLRDVIYHAVERNKYSAPVQVDIELPKNSVDIKIIDEVLTLDNISIAINGSKLSASGQINEILHEPNWDLTLQSPGLDIESLLAAYPMADELLVEGTEVKGKVAIDLRTSGEINDMQVMGSINLMNLFVLRPDLAANPTENVNISLILQDPVEVKLLDETVSFKNLLLQMDNTVLNVSGNANNLLGDVHWDVDINSEQIDLAGIAKVSPLFKDIFPGDVDFSGFGKLTAKAQGSLSEVIVNGEIDLTDTAFNLTNLFSKPTGSKLNMQFDAVIDPLTAGIKLNGQVDSHYSKLPNNLMFHKLLDALAKNAPSMRSQIASLKSNLRGNDLFIDRFSGKISFDGEYVTLKQVSVRNLRTEGGAGNHMVVNGKISLINNSVDLTGKLYLAPSYSTKLAGLNYPKEKGRLVIPVTVKNTLDDPSVTIGNRKDLMATR